MKQDAVKPLLFIAIPTRGMHSFLFSQDIAGCIYPSNFSMVQFYVSFREVGKARNICIQKALDAGAKYIVFRDEDTLGNPNFLQTLLFHMENHPDWTFCSALYATKSYPPEPLLYTEWGQGSDYNWQVGDLKKILFTGMGYSIIRLADLALLDAPEYVEPDYNTGAPVKIKEYFLTGDHSEAMPDGSTVREGHTEDAHFFKMLEEKGLNAYIDTSLLCRHIDTKTNTEFYVPTKGKPSAWNPPNGLPRTANLGAGGEYNPYELQVDLRGGPNIDVHADIRKLPDDWKEQFDWVKSSHVLEHFDFGQTYAILKEWTRILKPGGKMWLAVPDLQAVAEDILGLTPKDNKVQKDRGYDGVPGYMDNLLLGIIYGDQGHPFWRQEPYGGEHGGRFISTSYENNHHRSGFTARSLGGWLKALGMEDIRVKRQEYQLMVTCRKPGGESKLKKAIKKLRGKRGNAA